MISNTSPSIKIPSNNVYMRLGLLLLVMILPLVISHCCFIVCFLRETQGTSAFCSATLLTMPIPTPPGVFPEFNMVFRPGEPCDFSHMRNTIPTRYFDVNERIEQLRSYMNCEMHKNQIDVIKTTIRLYEEGTLDGRWGTHVIIQNGGIVPKDSLQLDKPYWIEVSGESWLFGVWAVWWE